MHLWTLASVAHCSWSVSLGANVVRIRLQIHLFLYCVDIRFRSHSYGVWSSPNHSLQSVLSCLKWNSRSGQWQFISIWDSTGWQILGIDEQTCIVYIWQDLACQIVACDHTYYSTFFPLGIPGHAHGLDENMGMCPFAMCAHLWIMYTSYTHWCRASI